MMFRSGTILAGLAAAALFGAAPAEAAAVVSPSIQVNIGGSAVALDGAIQDCIGVSRDGKEVLGDGSVRTCDGSVFVGRNSGASDLGSVTISSVFAFDPSLTWSLTATNHGTSAESFSVTFTMPVLAGPYNHLQNSLGGSLSDLTRERLGAVASGLTDQVSLDGLHIGAVDLGGDCSAEGSCPPGSPLGPLGTDVTDQLYAQLGTTISFTLAVGNELDLSGFVLLDTVPEPATLALFGVGLLGVGAMRRRQLRRG